LDSEFNEFSVTKGEPVITASGRTQALVTLATASIRPVSPKDILAVRQLDAA
jgi:hypothetical protein